METANIMLAIGGDRDNTVPKYNVTAAEVAVLRVIHGDDSVFDVDVNGTVQRTHRQEIGRLTEAYGRQDGERRIAPAVSQLYPGAAARVFEAFDELELDDSLYAAKERKISRSAPEKAKPTPQQEADNDLDKMTVKDLQALADKEDVDLTGVTKKADIIEAIETKRSAQQAAADDEDDEVGEINDEHSESNKNLFA